MSKTKGKLIVIEGTDGSGKATQSKLLLEYLKKHKISSGYFDFPQYEKTFFGDFVGQFLRGELGELGHINPFLISLPYALDRWQAKEKLDQALSAKKVVLCNRYAPANLAYQVTRAQGKLKNKLYHWLNKLEYQVFKIPKEDVVLFLYVPFTFAQTLLEKKGRRGYLNGRKKDGNEEDLELLRDVDKTYLWLLKKNKHWLRINCVEKNRLLSPQAIHEKVIQALQKQKYW